MPTPELRAMAKSGAYPDSFISGRLGAEQIHTLAEWTAVCIALLSSLLALAHFFLNRDFIALIIGLMTLVRGVIDASHIITVMGMVGQLNTSPDPIILTGALSRSAAAIILFAGVTLYLLNKSQDYRTAFKLFILFTLGMGGAAYLIFSGIISDNILPQAAYAFDVIKRPFDLIPFGVSLATLPFAWFLYVKTRSPLTATMFISLIPFIFASGLLTFGSSRVFDNNYFVAHYLKIFSYFILFYGLLSNYFKVFEQQKEYLHVIDSSEKWLRAVLNTVIDGIITIDKKGTIKNFNPSAQRIFQYTEKDVIGQNVKMLMPAPYHDEHDTYLHNYMTTGIPKIIGSGREVMARRKDGTVLPIELGVSEFIVGQTQAFVGSIRDISERKKNEKQIKMAIEQLVMSNQQLEQFAYVCSHDLQEPLRMISNYTERLEKHLAGTLDEKALHYMQYVTEGATRSRALINDVLSYARVATQTDQLEDLDTQKILEIVLSDLQVIIRDCGAKITYESLPVITMGRTHLLQLFQNLVSNAIKFRKKGAVPHIHVSAQPHDTGWKFCVSDDGIGIDPHYKDKIFMIFHRLNKRGEYPGTGIGLAICQKIVSHYGGTIEVESESGKGTRFVFTLYPEDHTSGEGDVT